MKKGKNKNQQRNAKFIVQILAVCLNGNRTLVKYTQNKIAFFVMFVHTYLGKDGTIITVKTPQYII